MKGIERSLKAHGRITAEQFIAENASPTMTRVEFDKLPHSLRNKFFRNGGKLIDEPAAEVPPLEPGAKEATLAHFKHYHTPTAPNSFAKAANSSRNKSYDQHRKIERTCEKFQNTPIEYLRLFSTAHQLDRDIASKRPAIIIHVGAQAGARGDACAKIFNPAIDGVSPAALAVHNRLLAEYGNLLALKHVLQNSTDFKRAVETVEPLFQELQQLEAQNQGEKLERAQKEANLAAAVRDAEARALEKAKADPAVAKACATLESAK